MHLFHVVLIQIEICKLLFTCHYAILIQGTGELCQRCHHCSKSWILNAAEKGLAVSGTWIGSWFDTIGETWRLFQIFYAEEQCSFAVKGGGCVTSKYQKSWEVKGRSHLEEGKGHIYLLDNPNCQGCLTGCAFWVSELGPQDAFLLLLKSQLQRESHPHCSNCFQFEKNNRSCQFRCWQLLGTTGYQSVWKTNAKVKVHQG